MLGVAALVLVHSLVAAGSEPVPAREIRLAAVVEAPAADVFSLWTTAEGLRTVFPGADARVAAEPGGDYCVIFDPAGDPEGAAFGTKGCKVITLEPSRAIAFEWKGTPEHPAMNARPFPTRVALTFAPEGDAAFGGATRVELVHSGFGFGEGWDSAFEFFRHAWQDTLDGLVERFSRSPPIDVAAMFAKAKSLFVVRLWPGPAALAPEADRRKFANHAAYVDRLRRRGIVLYGGPVGDAGEGLALLDVPDAATAARYFAADPAVQAGLFEFSVQRFTAAVQPGSFK